MDVGIVIASFVVTYCAAHRLDAPGPGSWAIVCAFAVATWRLNRSGLRWDELGLRWPANLGATLAWVVALYIASALMKVVAVDPLATATGWPAMDLSRFSQLPGNPSLLGGYLLLAWVSAALAEELVFRGFLLTRLEIPLGGGLAATVAAVIGQALLFGAGHWYLGLRGVATATSVGLVYGVVYVCNGRNLVPLIVAHGLTDSLSLIAIYARIVRIP